MTAGQNDHFDIMVAPPTTLDWVIRWSYRIAYRLACVYWFIRRPATQGAYVAVWYAGRLLVIRNSYKSQWSLPAGGVRRGESPRASAARELAEEVGIVADPESLRPAGIYEQRHEFKRDRCHLFELDLQAKPQITVDRREVVEARFLTPADVGRYPLANAVEQYWRDKQRV